MLYIKSLWWFLNVFQLFFTNSRINLYLNPFPEKKNLSILPPPPLLLSHADMI